MTSRADGWLAPPTARVPAPSPASGRRRGTPCPSLRIPDRLREPQTGGVARRAQPAVSHRVEADAATDRARRRVGRLRAWRAFAAEKALDVGPEILEHWFLHSGKLLLGPV